MPDKKVNRPNLITILTILLLLQAPLVLFLGLNLVTNHWTFLISWPVFIEDLLESYGLFLHTPLQIEGGEAIFFKVLALAILVVGAVSAVVAAILFQRGGALAWILSLFAQIAILTTGIGLFFLKNLTQAPWLMAVGILMVLYLNYGEVREWFLRADPDEMEPQNG